MAHPEPHSKILRQSDDLRVKTHINLHSVPGEGDKEEPPFLRKFRGYAGTALVSLDFKLSKNQRRYLTRRPQAFKRRKCLSEGEKQYNGHVVEKRVSEGGRLLWSHFSLTLTAGVHAFAGRSRLAYARSANKRKAILWFEKGVDCSVQVQVQGVLEYGGTSFGCTLCLLSDV